MAIAPEKIKAQFPQLTSMLLMISPDQFGFNEQTAATNAFQNKIGGSSEEVRNRALLEFRSAVTTLRRNQITAVVVPSRTDVVTPDAVFPNNWISFHNEIRNVDAVLYPMLAPNRRAERQFDKIRSFMPWLEIDPQRVLDLTHYEDSGQFLEGTGSLIFDRNEKVVFAHESPRTNPVVLDAFCEQTGYKSILFHAEDRTVPIYHTNVVMSIGDGFSVISFDAIPDQKERHTVEQKLKDLQLEVIDISIKQVRSFCGNVLEVKSASDDPKILLSSTAYAAFSQGQRRILSNYGELMPVEMPTIETVGGGSARCLVAEVFPAKN